VVYDSCNHNTYIIIHFDQPQSIESLVDIESSLPDLKMIGNVIFTLSLLLGSLCMSYAQGGEGVSKPFKFADGYPEFGDEDIVLQAARQESFDKVSSLETLIVNDKSKGYTYMLHLNSMTAVVADLPFTGGNHESAVNYFDGGGASFVVPHYETAEENGVGEGGGTPGSQVSLVNVRTGLAETLVAPPNPFGSPKPHGAVYVDESTLLTTAQTSNALVKWEDIDTFEPTATAYELPSPCNTPHLVFMIPNTNLAVSGCRCSNEGENDDNCQSALAILDVDTGEMRALDAPNGAEGITTTAEGQVWVGGLRATENQVAVYGPPDGEEPTLENIEELGRLEVPSPLRLAYDSETNTVAVVPLASTDSSVLSELVDEEDPNFYLFDATSRELLSTITLVTERGRINSEGLHAIGNGMCKYLSAFESRRSLPYFAFLYLPFYFFIIIGR